MKARVCLAIGIRSKAALTPFGLALAILLTTISRPLAADMPVKAPIVATAYNWSGFYAGLHAGYGWGRARSALEAVISGVPTPFDTIDLEEIPGSFRIGSSGFVGGGQFGYNYQVDRFILGIEADLSCSGLKGDHTVTGLATSGGPPVTRAFTSSQSQRLDWLATFRGRLGYTLGDSRLLYATGGLVVGKVEDSTLLAFSGVGGTTFIGSASSTRTGWTVGGGAEHVMTRDWTVRVEYLYFELGGTSVNGIDTVSPNQPFQTRAHFEHNGHIVRAGLNWKLN